MTKGIITISLSVLLVFLFFGCTSKIIDEESFDKTKTVHETNDTEEKTEYVRISSEEAKRMMEEPESYIILDVRTEAEFSEGHIKGAVLIPHNKIKEHAGDLLPDKDQIILIYCRSGNRSAYASLELIELGYKNVYDFGGIIDWPYDIEK
jgi:phage shock protein E